MCVHITISKTLHMKYHQLSSQYLCREFGAVFEFQFRNVAISRHRLNKRQNLLTTVKFLLLACFSVTF